MKKIFLVILIIILSLIISRLFTVRKEPVKPKLWEFQSIDTMKYSRDLAREKLNDQEYRHEIDRQISEIADTGATHVAIATPYDEEFYPFLESWVLSAREHNLKVWFRGNFSGWEGWFEYPSITRRDHVEKTENFILNHRELFQDGDIFTSCPECENGGPGDPRLNNDVKGHRDFLITEYLATKEAFKKINKNVKSNYYSMNADVARLVMDETTTEALDNVIVIDHYVKSPEELAKDVRDFSRGGNVDVVLGEYGVAIPDIHGDLTETEQAEWLNVALSGLIKEESLIGLSYWTNVGGSTELWDSKGKAHAKADVIKKFYDPGYYKLYIKNSAGELISADLFILNRHIVQSGKGVYVPAYKDQKLIISHKDYNSKELLINNIDNNSTIILDKKDKSSVYKAKEWFFQNISSRVL